LEIPIVFFEVTTLIAASVREFEIEEEFLVEHPAYGQSKGLINQIRAGVITGITTFTVEQQAEECLEKAILDELENKKDEIKKDKEKYRIYSTLLDSIQRNFKDNIRMMDRLSTNEKEVMKILKREVDPMYGKIMKIEITPTPSPTTFSPIFRKVAGDISRRQKEGFRKKIEQVMRKSIIPDEMDRIILSEAIFLKRDRYYSTKFYIASLDKHFCGKKSPYARIPIEIQERFDIECKEPWGVLRGVC